MGRFITVMMLPILLAAAAAAGPGDVIDNVQLTEKHFSPNADGVQDSTEVIYSLADTATVSIFVVEKDSSTLVNTLQSGQLQPDNTTFTVPWDGRNAGGTVVAEDTFLVLVVAATATATDSCFLDVFVDVSPPQVTITNILPSVFAPGSADADQLELKIDYTVADPPFGDDVFVTVVIDQPDGDRITLSNGLFSTGMFRDVWDGAEVEMGTDPDEGTHDVEITITDQAGNTDEAMAMFDVDATDPELRITSLTSLEELPVIPDSLFGWARDRSGIRSIEVRYAPAPRPFSPVPSTRVLLDTTFFAVALADSIVEQRSYTMGFKLVDKVGRERITPFSITFDSIPPAAPVLDPPAGSIRAPVFRLTGTVSSDAERMYIIRNDVPLDTIFPNLPGEAAEFPYDAPLVPGSNRFAAVAVDIAGNESAPSNEITVVYDTGAGLFIAEPFRPGDTFQINLTEPSPNVRLNIYDLGGNMVAALAAPVSGGAFTLSWDGLNGDGEEVLRGPLVAVAHARWADGRTETYREIFLFQP